MDVDGQADRSVAQIAAAIGEPARAAMLYNLMDGHARTSTELSVVADVCPSTASAHLSRLLDARLVSVVAQGKHRYYAIASPEVAAVLESLLVVAAGSRPPFQPNTPPRLRASRTCYDHLAGAIAVSLLARLQGQGWLRARGDKGYELTEVGAAALRDLGIDTDGLRRQRRKFACDCLDWSERKPHLGGALGAALLKTMLHRGWLAQDLDGRALAVTARGARELATRFAMQGVAHEDA
jgi:DNA-binding transcriptional ArsR family regulator